MCGMQTFTAATAEAHACCQPVLHRSTEQLGMQTVLNKAAVHWCWGHLQWSMECKSSQVQLQRRMPAVSLFGTATLSIVA